MVPERNLFSSKMKFTSIMYIETNEKPASTHTYRSSAEPSPTPGRSPGRCRSRFAPGSRTARSRPPPPARAVGPTASSGLQQVLHAEEQPSVGTQLHFLHRVLEGDEVFDVWVRGGVPQSQRYSLYYAAGSRLKITMLRLRV
jgi:hypothetical protein